MTATAGAVQCSNCNRALDESPALLPKFSYLRSGLRERSGGRPSRGLSCPLLLLIAFLIAPCSSANDVAIDAAHWRAVARSDLDFIHRTILEAHPGAIDRANPAFQTWMEDGYPEALSLLPRVHDYSTSLNAVRDYVTGFRDGHLFVSDQMRPPDELIEFQGWGVDERHGQFIVVTTARDWPVPLPPLGARLISCDGRSPESIVAEDVAPYVDRRDLNWSRRLRAQQLGTPVNSLGKKLVKCTFALGGAARSTLDVGYRAVTFEEFARVMHAGIQNRGHENGYELKDGTLWIHIPSFQLDSSQYATLRKMLDEIRRLHGVTQIVFDVRGNGGGDSSIGDMIFDETTGGLRFDDHGLATRPSIYAEWRVSKIAIDGAEKGLKQAVKTYGAASSRARWHRKLLNSLVSAQKSGRQWARQDSGERRLTRDDVAQRHGRLRRFAGRIAVLTDSDCMSACLDFVDQVRLVPGALHLGTMTGADSMYIDTTRVQLPSGNVLVMPLKVWRNRLRGNNEALVPDFAFDGDIDDDETVRRWLMSLLRTH